MDAREKFLATMNFDNTIPPPLWEMGCWAGTLRRWYQEGLPLVEGIDDQWAWGDGVSISFGLTHRKCSDPGLAVGLDKGAERLNLENGLFPKYTPAILEKDTDYIILIDEMGIKKKVRKSNDSIPEFYSWPIENRCDWEQIKSERLDPKTPGRYPDDLEESIARAKNRDYPLYIGSNPVGFFGFLRWLMGEVRLLTGYFDDPDLIKDIISYLTDFWIVLWEPILSRVQIDYVLVWEDMCYKTAPLISPELFRKFMLPAYKKFTSFLKKLGVDHIIVDTDGNFWDLVPLFLEGGVTGFFPCEVAAGMNVVKLREAFPQIKIFGGVDKRVLANSKKAIDRELEAKIPFMLKKGGYIPHVDHHIPPDVPFENFLYYRWRIADLINK